VARARKSKRPAAALFTIFTPPRNFHFDAKSEGEADQWVYQIRYAAKIDEWESGLGSSEDEAELSPGRASAPPKSHMARAVSASSKPPPPIHPHGAFGASVGSFSSISSAGAANFPGSSISLSIPPQTIEGSAKPGPLRQTETQADQERVLRNGKLYLLKSKGGVKKWKPVWAVLRPKSMAIYPNEQVGNPAPTSNATDGWIGILAHLNHTISVNS